MKIRLFIIFFLLCIVFSCEKDNSSIGFEPSPPGSYRYFSYDSLGTEVVSGWLIFEMTDSIGLQGSWYLKKIINRNDLGPQFGEGKLIGHIKNLSIWVELNPQVRDDNLQLYGTINDTRIDGKWYWLSYPGVTNWGTFEAVTK